MQLPEVFNNNMLRMLGTEEHARFLASLDECPPVSIRYNSAKWKKERRGMQVPWCRSGFYLESRPTFTFDPAFHAGYYYVQEASSMFLEHLLRRYVGEQPVVALDLCAAPGGKSTLTADALPEGSLLIANEAVRQRSHILAENMTKWGSPDVVVTHNYAADFQPLGSMFDLIICDVPCSGEGMFRKDEQAVKEWSADNVETCSVRQRGIVGDIWQCLRPGGLLVYSTCTFNMKEDEENVRWMTEELGAEILPCGAEQEWNIAGSFLEGHEMDVCHFFPHRNSGEGFFICIVRKPEDADCFPCRYRPQRKESKRRQMPKVPEEVRSWLDHPSDYAFFAEGDKFAAFPKHHLDVLDAVRGCLNVLCYGVTLAVTKGKALLPAHALAMSVRLAQEAFPCAELTYEQAVAYLRAEAVALPADAERGFVIVTYQGMPLGFVKNIGHRANNMYPQEWRIRSGYTPEAVVCV